MGIVVLINGAPPGRDIVRVINETIAVLEPPHNDADRAPVPGPTQESGPRRTQQPALEGGRLTARELAEYFRCDPEVARKRLERWRLHNFDGWSQLAERARGEPKYLYDLAVVAHVFADMTPR